MKETDVAGVLFVYMYVLYLVVYKTVHLLIFGYVSEILHFCDW